MFRTAKWIRANVPIRDVVPEYSFAWRIPDGKEVRCAVMEITALGVYKAMLNGQRVGQFVLAPGWTVYEKRLQVQQYDVTALLARENRIAVRVGRGWYASPMPGWFESEEKSARFARQTGLIAEIRITYADGDGAVISTDGRWQWCESPVRFSEIYDGEVYDASFPDAQPKPCIEFAGPDDTLIPQEGEEIRETARVSARSVLRTPKGETLVDFGQEVTGYVEFSVNAHAGDEIRILHGEVLDKDGSYRGSSRQDFIATAFYAYSTQILIWVGQLLGEDMTEYIGLKANIVKAFREAFPTCLTQTEHVLAIHFGLCEDAQTTADSLADMVRRDGIQLKTGFVGTPYILHVLSDYGHADLAWDLLLREQYPSWLYPVGKGATTIWEHWDGIMENGDFWSADMNSFNHYAYGSVIDWMYEKAAGIRHDSDHPGFSHVMIAPTPDARIGRIEAELRTVNGKVSSRWICENDAVRYEISTEMPATVCIAGRKTDVAPGNYIFWSAL